MIIKVFAFKKTKPEAKTFMNKLLTLKKINSEDNLFLDFEVKKVGLFKKQYKFKIYYRRQGTHRLLGYKYKDVLPRINLQNTAGLKYILGRLLDSYKKYRNSLEFHGNISQSAIIPVIKNKFDTNPTSDDNRIQNNDFFLSYNHQNMLTVKEWIHFRQARLKNNTK